LSKRATLTGGEVGALLGDGDEPQADVARALGELEEPGSRGAAADVLPDLLDDHG
jgi:hypothetical protein